MATASSGAAVLKVLVIEDNPDDAVLLQEYLGESDDPHFEVQRADSLIAGLGRVRFVAPDVLLLDLSLADSQGLETVVRAREEAPEVPIVVLTGLNDEDVAVKALQEGAQDYLVKSRVNSASLVRSIKYAIQRHRIQQGLRQARKDLGTAEFRALGRGPDAQEVSAPVEVFGPRTLAENQARDLTARLAQTMDLALGSASPGDGRVSERLQDLARLLGEQGAGPRDVMEVYVACLREKGLGSESVDFETYRSKSFRIALELMGYLVAHYQTGT